jgi:hypothetical protein
MIITIRVPERCVKEVSIRRDEKHAMGLLFTGVIIEATQRGRFQVKLS